MEPWYSWYSGDTKSTVSFGSILCQYNYVPLDGLVHSSGSMETASSEPAGPLDGRQHHLPLPHHDGGHDAGQACAGHLQLQRRWAGFN